MPATRSAPLSAMAILLASQISAQQADSTRCRTLLTAPTHDSVVVRIGMTVTSFDTSSVISDNYRALFVQSVRQALKLPRPLPVEVYGIVTPRDDRGRINGDGTVAPMIVADYRATLKRDGRITNARVVGGARTKPVDDAVLAAIQAVGDSQAAPPFAEDTKADTVELRLSLRVMGGIPARIAGQPPEPTYEPLFAMRVPSFGFPSSMVRSDPANPHPRYPGIARMARADGGITAEFIVSADGKADLRSLQFLNATATPFIDAVLEVLPQYRFSPLAIGGCPIATLARMPFNFEIRR